jgi:hypothetical protein
MAKESALKGDHKRMERYGSIKEWQQEAIKRFGDDPKNWAFVCPACGKITTIAEMEAAGGDRNDAAQECIGRHNNKATGCDWCSYGLFGTCGKGVEVVTDNDKAIEVFDFAPGPIIS